MSINEFLFLSVWNGREQDNSEIDVFGDMFLRQFGDKF